MLEEVQRRLDNNPQAMRQRRETVEHPFGTMKARMGATHFLTKTLPKVGRRDGSIGPGLQSDTGHEHPWDQAADRCDRGLRNPRSWLPRPDISKAVLTRPRPISDIRCRVAGSGIAALHALVAAWLRLRLPRFLGLRHTEQIHSRLKSRPLPWL